MKKSNSKNGSIIKLFLSISVLVTFLASCGSQNIDEDFPISERNPAYAEVLIEEFAKALSNRGYSATDVGEIESASRTEVIKEKLSESEDPITIVPEIFEGALSIVDLSSQNTERKNKIEDITLESLKLLDGRMNSSSSSAIALEKSKNVFYSSDSSTDTEKYIALYNRLASVILNILLNENLSQVDFEAIEKEMICAMYKFYGFSGLKAEDLDSTVEESIKMASSILNENESQLSSVQTALETLIDGVVDGIGDTTSDSSFLVDLSDEILNGAIAGFDLDADFEFISDSLVTCISDSFEDNGVPDVGVLRNSLLETSSQAVSHRTGLPIAVEKHVSTVRNIELNFSLSGVDASSAIESYLIVSNPKHGTLQLDQVTGEIEYQPDLGFYGSDSFTFSVTNASSDTSEPAKIHISVIDDNWTNTVQFGGSNDDYAFATAVDNNGYIYLAGLTDTQLGDQTFDSYYGNSWVAKYTTAGNRIWIRQFHTNTAVTNFFVSMDITIDPSGDLYVTGGNYLDATLFTYQGHADTFIYKLDTDGNTLWKRQIGGPEDDIPSSIKSDLNGNIYIAGYSESDFEGGTNQGELDGYLIKYDKNGNKIWSRQIGGNGNDAYTALTLDSNNKIYVTGWEYIPNYGKEILISKFDDQSGDQLWSKNIEGVFSSHNFDDWGVEMAITSSENIFIAGGTNSALQGTAWIGGSDTFLAKLDMEGDLINLQRFGNIDNDYFRDMCIDKSDNLYITGSTVRDFHGAYAKKLNSQDVILMKFDSSGDLQSATLSGDEKSEYGSAVSVTDTGKIFVAGQTVSNLDGNTSFGNYDAFIMSFDAFGTIIENLKPTMVSFSPSDGLSNVSVFTNDYESLSIEFSEMIDNSTLSVNVLDTECSGNYQISFNDFDTCLQFSRQPVEDSSHKKYVFYLAEDLTTDTPYKINIEGVKDLAGNDLVIVGSPYSFTTKSVVDLVYDFEDGIIPIDSTQSSNFTPHQDWSVIDCDSGDGSKCANPGDLFDSEYSCLNFNQTTGDGLISFKLKTSTEASYDKFRLYIDSSLKVTHDGINDWFTVRYVVSEGTHDFGFCYYKDSYVSKGDDTIWIDRIVFPK